MTKGAGEEHGLKLGRFQTSRLALAGLLVNLSDKGTETPHYPATASLANSLFDGDRAHDGNMIGSRLSETNESSEQHGRVKRGGRSSCSIAEADGIAGSDLAEYSLK
ncbi:hypothetical protein FGSG_13603 [Fusarium graminearum PH-1]|uniref:hypothetical protein n=1 Tax=Gibberella zeae (strain ATCC MYA-4620 / CBS 123657 / FGSC 9075 / NRRL 31084 / PH-1) TaxID=229533 RepID=UPI00021F17B4|nr:hypothetical protein FGSG_13603 [Fusarium graminearum PH-1]ESU16148.1 hypothetical protein FGSG_13603 [Fusarium graminearum PH-1]|eukprot:XP_011328168.1 hypothetical protein FGSG_13603 [Fusarium graminearum PH-1]